MGSAVPFDPGISTSFLFIVLLLIASFTTPVFAGRCRRDQCNAVFKREGGTSNGRPRTAPPQQCTAWTNFLRCLRETYQPCLGDLIFHSHLIIARRMLANLSCDAVLQRSGGSFSTPVPVITTEPTSHSPTTSHIPSYGHQLPVSTPPLRSGRNPFRLDQCRTPEVIGDSVFCALFGDPHVRTFDGRYQTCRARGAWPLIDNAFLAVQVTSVPVAAGGSGPRTPTVPSLITVIVKAQEGCTNQLTYEASAGNLPSTFVDGTHQSSSEDPAVILRVVQPRRHIRLQLRHINTTLVLRRTSDNQLTFASRLPTAIVTDEVADGGTQQLCTRGCPRSQQISVGGQLGALPSGGSRGGGRVSRSRKLRLVEQVCRRHGLTDFYLDACVFDAVFGGGRVAGYARSAQLAQLDLEQLAPHTAAQLARRTQLELAVVTEAADSAATTACLTIPPITILSFCFVVSSLIM